MMLSMTFARDARFPDRASLEGAHEAFAGKSDDDEGGEGWESIVPRAMAGYEEHNIKHAYVQRELWRRYQHWTGFRTAASSFTLTPNLGPRKHPTDSNNALDSNAFGRLLDRA